MWGQGFAVYNRQRQFGIIPMRVGTRTAAHIRYTLREDHPHACGDKLPSRIACVTLPGSSPCVWGQETSLITYSIDNRIIPMRVGTSYLGYFAAFGVGDHPHACGDKQAVCIATLTRGGSSPCVWGQVKSLRWSIKVIGIIPMRVGTS